MKNPIDYAEMGLKVGLEVHQQLLTDHKMFCRCPAGLYTTTHDGVVLRHMRPTLSELGKYDGTALMEFKTRKNIVYLLHRSNVCTYEMDDTPPFLVNQQAVDIAIEQCLMLGCDIVDELHIARKQYLDGSIPTGFQRTAIVGVGGQIPFRGRQLRVIQVSVEEDSCREVSDRGHSIVWRADRLGMPLIETVTEPDLHTPEEVAEAILLIGRVCRSTEHVRIGIGASRQDVNVSVRGGRRVEIKGVARAALAAELVHSEALRQVGLLSLAEELKRRGFTRPEDIATEHRAVTRFFARSPLALLHQEHWERFLAEGDRRPGLERGEGPFTVRAVRLPGLAGTLSWPCQPELTFAHELAGRVRVIATLDQQPILLHSEKWPDYEGARQELRRLKKRLGCTADDALVVVWGAESDTITAAEEIRLRYCDALDGVPHETRQPMPDGSTDFERILPGPERMYPDTDSPPQRLTGERVDALRLSLPEAPWERQARYCAAGAAKSTAHYLIRRGGARLVDRVVRDGGADIRRACLFFGEEIKGWRRAGIAVDKVSEESWCALFRCFHQQPTLWEARSELVRQLAEDPELDLDHLTAAYASEPEGWRDSWRQTAQEKRPPEDKDQRQALWRELMGRAMTELRGRVPATQVNAVLTAAWKDIDERT